MESSPLGSTFGALLRVQQLDTTLTQLHHRRAALPERAELETARTKRTEVGAALVPLRAAQSEANRRLRSLEDEAATVATKIADADRKLFSGSVTSPRELQALQTDVEVLKKRQGELEDAALEVMIEREPLDAEVDAAVAQLGSYDADEARLLAAIADAEAVIDAEARDVGTQRQESVATIPSDLTALYEKIRTANKGIGIARLEHGTCMACRLKLPAVELDRIRQLAGEALVRCEECGAILVR